MESILEWCRVISRKRIIKYGVPFFLFMVGGSFGLREFSNLRYQYGKRLLIKPEEVEQFGITMKKPGEVTLESEYEKIKKLDIDTWENVRGPRPWEEQPSKE